jgi:hypothetical protein
MDENEQTPAEEGKHAAKAKRSRRKAAKTQETAESVESSETLPAKTPPQDAEQPKQWTSNLPEPFPRHTIDLGDGHRLKFSRSNRWQQSRIEFTAPENQDPKPNAKYTRWLRDRGWQWRDKEKAWTKQLAKNSEDHRFARADTDRANEDQFAELANLIRQDKGLGPVHQADEQRGVGT